MNNDVLESSFFFGAHNGEYTYSDNELIIISKEFRPTHENMHTHNFFEFDIIAGGEGRNITTDGHTEVRRGHLVFGTPANMHSVAASDGGMLHIFNLQFVGGLEKIMIDTFGTFDGFVLELSEEELEYIISELSEVLLKKDYAQRKLLAHGVAIKVIAAVFEVYRRQIEPSHKEQTAKSIFEALLYIRRNYSSELHLEDVARHVSFSADYLGKRIKKHTGKGFMRYLLDIRLDNAYLLLSSENVSVKEVCVRVGYSSYANFYYAFRERFGVNPGEVREMSPDESAKHFRKSRASDIARINSYNKFTQK